MSTGDISLILGWLIALIIGLVFTWACVKFCYLVNYRQMFTRINLVLLFSSGWFEQQPVCTCFCKNTRYNSETINKIFELNLLMIRINFENFQVKFVFRISQKQQQSTINQHFRVYFINYICFWFAIRMLWRFFFNAECP